MALLYPDAPPARTQRVATRPRRVARVTTAAAARRPTGSSRTDGELRASRLVPQRMDPEVFSPRVVTGAEADDILGDVRSTSTGPFVP